MIRHIKDIEHRPRAARFLLLRCIGLALLLTASLGLSGCIATLTEVQDMRREINETKLDVGRLQTSFNESLLRIEYRLDQIDSKLASRQEIDKIVNQQMQDDLMQIRGDLQMLTGGRSLVQPTRTTPAPPAATETSAATEAYSSAEAYPEAEAYPPAETSPAVETSQAVETAAPATPEEETAPAAAPASDEGSADLLAAKEAHARRDYAQSTEIYQKWLEQYASSAKAPEVVFNLGRCRYDMGEYDQARETFDRIVSGYPASEIIPQSLHSRALCEMKLGQWATALQTLEFLRLMYPDYNAKKIEALVENVRSNMR
ncbi:tetratricopeptide repeat protein [Candidatus Sumerlaeota bacterium]|nr:tetratricopeptide repeat protein [Candidatus Sumerlaeota bacterium]